MLLNQDGLSIVFVHNWGILGNVEIQISHCERNSGTNGNNLIIQDWFSFTISEENWENFRKFWFQTLWRRGSRALRKYDYLVRRHCTDMSPRRMYWPPLMAELSGWLQISAGTSRAVNKDTYWLDCRPAHCMQHPASRIPHAACSSQHAACSSDNPDVIWSPRWLPRLENEVKVTSIHK